MITHNIISTGSKGNAVVINGNILIDCGVPFASLKSVVKALQLIILTHSHSDHFSPRTIRKLALERPSLRWLSPPWLAADMAQLVSMRNLDIAEMNQGLKYTAVGITPFPLKHNVPNCGWKLCFENGEKVLYATDTNTMSHVEAPNYDLYLLEANYCEDEIRERIRAKMEIGAYCYEHDVLHNHLSKQKADDWLYQNMGANSRYVYLHGHESVLKTG